MYVREHILEQPQADNNPHVLKRSLVRIVCELRDNLVLIVRDRQFARPTQCKVQYRTLLRHGATEKVHKLVLGPTYSN